MRQLGRRSAQGRAGDRRPAHGDRARREGDAERLNGRVVRVRPGLPVHQGRDRRGPLRLRGGRAPRAEATRPRRSRRSTRLEKKWRGPAAEARGRDRRAATPTEAPVDDAGEDASSTPRRRRSELLRGERRGWRTSSRRSSPASSRSCATCPSWTWPTRPEGQPDHAPPNLHGRRDLHGHAQGGPLHHLPPGHRQEGLRGRAASPSPPIPNMELYLRGAHPVEQVGCTACHQGRGRATGFAGAAHTPAARSRRRPGASTRGSESYAAASTTGTSR